MKSFAFLYRAYRFGHIRIVLLATVLLSAGVIPGGGADHPEWDDRLAATTGVEFQPRLGSYHYEIHWATSRVAKGTISIRRDGDQYVLQADQRTTEFIDRIYRVRYRGETRINVADLTPSESVIEEEVKKRKKTQKATYDASTGAVTVEETRSRKKRPAKKKTYELRTDTGILDVFSAIFLARSFDWHIGERHEFQVFIGEKQYAVTMDCIGRSTFTLQGRTIPVWVVRPGVRRSTETDPSPVSLKTRIFIAADTSKDIVKIATEPGIGAVTLRLVEYREH